VSSSFDHRQSPSPAQHGLGRGLHVGPDYVSVSANIKAIENLTGTSERDKAAADLRNNAIHVAVATSAHWLEVVRANLVTDLKSSHYHLNKKWFSKTLSAERFGWSPSSLICWN